jgi:excisionase family DNA binding protein
MAAKTVLQIESISGEAFVLQIAKEVAKIVDAKFGKGPTHSNEDPYLTRKEVADMFKVTVCTIHNWVKKDILKPHKIGNKIRFLTSEVKAATIAVSKKEVVNE